MTTFKRWHNYRLAEQRVLRSPTLREYSSIILADWGEGYEHWKWVCTAPIREIEEWARHIDEHAGRPGENNGRLD